MSNAHEDPAQAHRDGRGCVAILCDNPPMNKLATVYCDSAIGLGAGITEGC